MVSAFRWVISLSAIPGGADEIALAWTETVAAGE
jgi:hypothetical protein